MLSEGKQPETNTAEGESCQSVSRRLGVLTMVFNRYQNEETEIKRRSFLWKGGTAGEEGRSTTTRLVFVENARGEERGEAGRHRGEGRQVRLVVFLRAETETETPQFQEGSSSR